jgi:hypothetical protein
MFYVSRSYLLSSPIGMQLPCKSVGWGEHIQKLQGEQTLIHASHMLAMYIAKIYLTYLRIDSMASER